MNNSSSLFDFEKLSVYQKSLDFVDEVYELSATFPKTEEFNLTSQFRRAATSIALNIAEGSGGTRKEFIQFLNISRRSLRECIVCLTISKRRKYLDTEHESALRNKLTEISKMLSGLINYLETEKAKNILLEDIAEYCRAENFYKDLPSITQSSLQSPNSKLQTTNYQNG